MNLEVLRSAISVNRPSFEGLGFHFPDLTKPEEARDYIDWAQQFLIDHPPTVEEIQNIDYIQMMRWDITPEDEYPATPESLKGSERKRVLILSSHSDDTEITSTALIQDWKQRGYLVDILLLTAGSAGKNKLPHFHEQTTQEVRVAEQLRAASGLGVNRVYVPRLPLAYTQSVAEQFKEFSKSNTRDFQYGITEWFWKNMQNRQDIDPQEFGIAIRTLMQPSIIVSPNPLSDGHIDHKKASQMAEMMWENGGSASFWQDTYPGILPLEAWYQTVVWGKAGTPTPDFNEYASYNIEGHIARLKTWLLYCFASQSERYSVAAIADDLRIGTYRTIGQRSGPYFASEKFTVVKPAKESRPNDEIPQRNLWF